MDTKVNSPQTTPPLDRIDEAIIDVLRHNGRITYEKLSSLVHLTPRPCLERVRKLERRGVIRGYGAIIDVQMVSPLGCHCWCWWPSPTRAGAPRKRLLRPACAPVRRCSTAS
ncbi:UNVERIFIED_ORG: hypothetical protein OKW25_001793 [Pseudomonas vranovensis]|nr:hypothetical protein [Pseudomonas vranovensis]